MKKVSIFILSLILIFSITTSCAVAEGITIRKYKGYVYRVDGWNDVDDREDKYLHIPSNITITDYKGNKKSITIPKKLKTANKIERHKKKEFSIPKKLRKAKIEAIEGYGKLERVHVSAGVEIRNIWNAERLKKITVDKKHKSYSVKNNLLYNKKKTTLVSTVCEKLSPKIAKSVKVIGTHAFHNAEFSEFIVPKKVRAIDDFAFYNSKNLEKIEWNSRIKKIGHGAFKGCSALREVIIPNSVSVLGGGVFENCTNLSSVTFGKNISAIGNSFEGCVNLKELRLPETINTIYKYSAIGGNIENIYIYNKDCKFYYSKKGEDKCSVSNAVTIHGYKGSTAEEYAKKNGNKFVALD